MAEPQQQEQGESNEATTVRNLNSYYGNKIGFVQSLSLILNAGLMIYAHLGLSGVILSSQDPALTSADSSPPTNNATDLCTDEDITLWSDYGGEDTRPTHSSFCSREYEDGRCLTNAECISECFQTTYGYTADCSSCFAAIPLCGVGDGCFLVCATDSVGPECQECNSACIAEMRVCAGLPDDTTNVTRRSLQVNTTETSNGCNAYDLDAIDAWYNVYDLTFVGSVQDAWNGDAQLLAVIVILFSGIWPYAKNIILLIVWYIPMAVERQTSTILWLSRLSKYTLVDVFAVVMVLVGSQFQLNVGGTEAVLRAEPRFGIIAFFLATIWEFLQIEVIKAMHEEKVLGQNKTIDDEESNDGTASNPNASKKEGLLFSQLGIPAAILVVSVGLFVAGAATEVVQFTSTDINAETGCTKSYNLVTLGNALINDLSLADNSAAWQTWIIYVVYVLLNLVLPILVHLMQIVLMVRWKTKGDSIQQLTRLSLWISAIWCFAGVEVLLIGIFAVEFKFSELVTRIAGQTNALFLDITSGLGPGFYLLIAYSVVAGFLQFSLRITSPTKGRNETVGHA